MKKKEAAVFLDRDGTIIEDRGDLRSADDVRFFSDTFDSLRRLGRSFRLFIVTNQSGVAKGALTMPEVNAVNTFVVDELRRQGIDIDDVYVCPHRREDKCICSKPSPHFLNIAAERYGLELKSSYVIGDHPHDVATALAVGATGIYLLTGHGLKHRAELTGTGGWVTAARISDAAGIILDELRVARKERLTPVESAVHSLRRGGLAAFPTETVYGLGANALDPVAVARIFEAKQRPHFDPLIVHLPDYSWLAKLTRALPECARKLTGAFWPGPLTLVLPRKQIVPDIVTAGLDTVAVRIPDHPLATELLRMMQLPLAAPSANRFGSVSPTSAEHVRTGLGEQVDYILDGGECRVGLESTIIAFDADNIPVLLRPGGIPVEAVEEICGTQVIRLDPKKPGQGGYTSPVAPGMLERHYAPDTALHLFAAGAPIPTPPTDAKCGLLLVQPRPEAMIPDDYSRVEILSANGSSREVAHKLFASMRQMDASGLDFVFAEMAEESGLGSAINDRLRRASS